MINKLMVRIFSNSKAVSVPFFLVKKKEKAAENQFDELLRNDR
ncbi:hypothetical protein EMGBS15_11190 [Filimonas sp.]|jgi:hypothetical protein|nr:hypothetical protein EMGBS15_11190 [Filimonas sp.]